MFKRVKKFWVVILVTTLLGCTPGVFTQLGSTAPSFGPIVPGITREDAERHLGVPILSMEIDAFHYRNIYAYEVERSEKYALFTDAMDMVTFDLGTLIFSPIDRFKGTRHLLAITYQIQDDHAENDRVIAVMERLEGLKNPVQPLTPRSSSGD